MKAAVTLPTTEELEHMDLTFQVQELKHDRDYLTGRMCEGSFVYNVDNFSVNVLPDDHELCAVINIVTARDAVRVRLSNLDEAKELAEELLYKLRTLPPALKADAA